MDKQRVIAIAVSGAGILGTFLPWASIGGLFSVEGTRGDGWITLVLFAAATAVSATGDRGLPMTAGRGFAVYLLSLCALAVALFDASNLARQQIQLSVGSGIYLVIVTASVVMFVSSLSCNLVLTVATVLFGGAVTFAGFVHLISGAANGTKMCRKEQWSLMDTFINVDTLAGKPVSSLPPNVAKALLDCGALTLQRDAPAIDSSQQQETSTVRPGAEFAGVPCTVPNASEFRGRTAKGQCADENDCGDGFVMYSGFCRGPANIVCCVKAP